MVILRVCLGTVQYWRISIGLVVVQLRAVFCPSVQYLSLFCEAFSWAILYSSHFPLFHSGQVFYQFVCPLTIIRDYRGEGSMESLGVMMDGHVKAPSHHYTQNNSN